MNSEYRRGVEDALKSFQVSEVYGMIIPTNAGHGGMQFIVDAFSALAEKRRKSLLTKKVTKWANVYDDNNAFLYDTKEEAGKSRGASCLGSFPIEIEVPID